jgi:translation initiation factor IF-2
MATDTTFKKVRLFSLSKELNLSIDTLVLHLKEKGYTHAIVGVGPNAAVTEEDAYLELMAAYSTDKVAAARLQAKRVVRHQAEAEVLRPAPKLVVEEKPEKAGKTAPPVEPEEVLPPLPSEVPVPPPPVEETLPPPVEAVEVVAEAEVAPPVPGMPASEEVAPEPPPPPPPAQVAEVVPPSAEEIVEEATSVIPDQPVEPAPVAVPAVEPSPLADEAALIMADRYKLTGPKVVGKVDIATLDESSAHKKRKRKRKKKDEPDEAAAPAKDTKSSPGEKPAEKPRTGAVASASSKKKKKRKGPVVDEAEVAQTLQDTLREMGQGTSRVRQRRRRERREERAADRQRELEYQIEQESVLRVTEFISTGELANLMSVPVNEVISKLFSMGMMVSINQRLDADTITIVAEEFGFDISFITDLDDVDLEIEEDDPEDLSPRAPVVTVMGHVDHGKTSLLDYIRRTNVVAGEAGGITQHIGAYHVRIDEEREITFLDTPGHEAFTAMRARGAQVTDLVILVVAADDAVMPQTLEAINHARAAEVPIVVAINKVDKPDANIPKVMAQLADHNVIVEQYGGKVQCALVSAKQGTGIEDLLEKVLLEAELLELEANPDRNAIGAVIESRLEKGRGNVATVLVQNGTLEVGDAFVCGIHSGRVRAMFDEREHRVEVVGPARPVLVIGFEHAPDVGDMFVVMDDEREAREIAQRRQQIHREQSLRQRKHITLDEIGRRMALGEFKELKLIVKADVGGSVEALSDALLKLSTPEVAVVIVHSGVGAITESDVQLAQTSDAVIIGFQVRPNAAARSLAEREEIDIRLYSIIYNAIEEVRDGLEGLLSPERSEKITGVAEVRETFRVPKVGTVAGCSVVEGKIRRSDRVRIIRDGVVIYEGGLNSLRRFKDDVREVLSGYECGIGIENFNDIKVGDNFEAYEIVETKRKLEV